MTQAKQKNTNNAVGAGAAGFAVGAATVAAAVTLSNKENRKKAGKAINGLRTKIMEMKKPTKAKIEEVKDGVQKTAANYSN